MDATRYGKKKIIFIGIILALIGTLVSLCVLNNNPVSEVFNSVSKLFYKESNPSAALKTLSFKGHEYANTMFDGTLDEEYYTIEVFED